MEKTSIRPPAWLDKITDYNSWFRKSKNPQKELSKVKNYSVASLENGLAGIENGVDKKKNLVKNFLTNEYVIFNKKKSANTRNNFISSQNLLDF